MAELGRRTRTRGAAFVAAAALTFGGLLGVLLGGCTGSGGQQAGSNPAAAPSKGAPPSAVAPPPPQPAREAPCPYLDTAVVQNANGQHIGYVRISADRPYPACFFYRWDNQEQVRTWIVVGTPKVAGAAVDAAAPVATSDRAELPGGWSGGSQPTAEGSVFAVAKGGTAVVVTTNQKYTVGAREIAEQVIAGLGR